MRVVLDTNVIVSALLYGGKPKHVVDLATKSPMIAVTSEVLLKELANTLYRLNHKYHYEGFDIVEVLKLVTINFELVEPMMDIHVLADEPDNRVLEAAISGTCSRIITGDKKFLELGAYDGIKIITVKQFLEEL